MQVLFVAPPVGLEPTTGQKPRVALLATARIAPGFFRIFFVFLSRKKVVAAASRRERACKRTGEPSVPFCEEEEWTLLHSGFCRKNRNEAKSIPTWRRSGSFQLKPLRGC